MRAIIAGAGPAGFACAKWLNDRGHDVVLVEKRAVPGGKVSAWRDADGDWVESCTALVEHANGRMEILDWAERKREEAKQVSRTSATKVAAA